MLRHLINTGYYYGVLFGLSVFVQIYCPPILPAYFQSNHNVTFINYLTIALIHYIIILLVFSDVFAFKLNPTVLCFVLCPICVLSVCVLHMMCRV